jgi:superfamily II DNA/RNA helicase
MAGIEKLGFETCTEIQATAIPYIQAGKDLAGLAQTGTGKTAAFLLPLMDRILKSREASKSFGGDEAEAFAAEEPFSGEELEKINEQNEDTELTNKLFKDWKKQNYMLVLVPTRELADQVCSNVRELCPGGEIQAVAIFGGTSYEKQIEAVKKGVEIIVATPGRLIDLYKEHVVDLNQIRAVVFDEADRMFDMGFKDDMKYVLKRIPKDRQFLVFSATLNFDVMNTAYEFGADPVEINISKDQATAENVEDELFHVGHHDKPAYLLSLLKQHQPRQLIIFSNFKKNVERIALFLNKNGYPAVGISSLLTQAQRIRVMEQFKAEGGCNILVATDVAARGLDVIGVDMVINYEMPDDPENYVHRIGRTGRASAKGRAFSMVSDRDVEALARIEVYTKKKIPNGWIEDEFLVKTHEPFPRDNDFEYGKGGGRSRDRDRSGGGGRSGGPRDKKFGDRKRNGGGGGPQRYSKKPHEGAASQGEGRPPRGEGRPPRAEGRGRDESRRHHEKSANGATPQAQGNSAHRDRTTGRHKPHGPRQEAGAGSRNDNNNPKRSEQQRHRSHKHRNSNRPRRGGDAPKATPAPQSLGKKIGGFLKKIFG